MSDGKTHAAANLLVLGATVLVSTQLPLTMAGGAIAGAVAGTLITPDADLVGVTYTERQIQRHGGWLLGGLWLIFWQRYAQTHSHRGSSHRPFVGTLGRWRYVVIRLSILWIPALLYYHSFVIGHAFECLQFIYMAFLFNAFQDIVHLILDGWRFHKGK